jgi:hypothetical protein
VSERWRRDKRSGGEVSAKVNSMQFYLLELPSQVPTLYGEQPDVAAAVCTVQPGGQCRRFQLV